MGQQLPESVSAFLDAFVDWAGSQPQIAAVALVGSHARGAAQEDSDVDLVILTPLIDRYLRNRSWLSLFGQVREWRDEDYGRVTSIRCYYESGLEVEYGFSTADWAAPPIDTGTLSVVSRGLKVLHDPHGIIARMQEELRSNGE